MILTNDVKNNSVNIKISKRNFDEDIADALCCIAMMNYRIYKFYFPEGLSPNIDEDFIAKLGLRISYQDDKKLCMVNL